MAIYHLSVKVGSRSTGQSAAAKFAYICREERYRETRRDADKRELVHAESGMMPAWAEKSPALYWKSADLYERANGRLFQQVEFALPRELDRAAQIELARRFAEELTNTKDGLLPYTLAVHSGKGENPHAHLMVSERVHDGRDRSPETWFKRAATGDKTPEQGGARKTAAFQSREWIDELRQRWALRANQALERAGHEARIDHRSHAERGIVQVPTIHEGPNVRQMHARGLPGERVELNKEIRAANVELSRMGRIKAKIKRSASVLRELASAQWIQKVRESTARAVDYLLKERTPQLSPEELAQKVAAMPNKELCRWEWERKIWPLEKEFRTLRDDVSGGDKHREALWSAQADQKELERIERQLATMKRPGLLDAITGRDAEWNQLSWRRSVLQSESELRQKVLREEGEHFREVELARQAAEKAYVERETYNQKRQAELDEVYAKSMDLDEISHVLQKSYKNRHELDAAVELVNAGERVAIMDEKSVLMLHDDKLVAALRNRDSGALVARWFPTKIDEAREIELERERSRGYGFSR